MGGPEVTLVAAIDHYLKLTRPRPGRIIDTLLDSRTTLEELRQLKQDTRDD